MYTGTPTQTRRERAKAEVGRLSPLEALERTRARLACCGDRPSLTGDALDRLGVLVEMLQPDYEPPPDPRSQRQKLIDQTRVCLAQLDICIDGDEFHSERECEVARTLRQAMAAFQKHFPPFA